MELEAFKISPASRTTKESIDKFRHEYKYICTNTQIAMLQNRIKNLLHLDSHVSQNSYGNSYNIRSLYFDDMYNHCYHENEDGTDPREKFRIRIYNHNAGKISLENKKKVRGMTQKISCSITEEQCRILMSGKSLPDHNSYPELLQKLLLQMRTRLLKPVVIVDYDRIPYIYKNGNVRVTFDKNIMSSNDLEGFLDENIAGRPIMPTNQHVLEVKWDEYLPDFIYSSLQIDSLKQTNFSKYYLCRRYDLHQNLMLGNYTAL